MIRIVTLFNIICLLLCLTSCATTHSAGAETTRFVAGNLCDKSVDITFTELATQAEQALAFGITPNKMLGVAVIHKQKSDSNISHYTLAPFKQVTLKYLDRAVSNNEKLNWFKQFRMSTPNGYTLKNPKDANSWLRSTTHNQVTYTFFVCTP